ncbi:hypothetical protein LZ24_02750 [Desulfobotulus alkaliphilus]|uniref:Class 3 adenylate cyclase n=1 Tax=Desulfobotulus alkaliphilus TaxID=622671 RepID=A0A562RDX8_9BACT|nr:hypothetical protein [Desulfobotulus alkaliphilus]TWI67218.1 hypothetical protein LZ24_02750 [Desulfobotulus alkaliphilus]
MAIELKQHYVAFLDILGFTAMVRSDVTSENQPHLGKLFRCHQSAGNIFKDDPYCTVTQFSDSIVVAKPFEVNGFEWFATKVAEYQRLLLDEGLICRGGIAVNKHFSNGTFTFSAGLIDAYFVESTVARFPRVVVSRDLIDLIYPDQDEYPKFLIKEDDGLVFVDYLGLFKDQGTEKLTTSIVEIVLGLTASKRPSLREKGMWLSSYSDAVLGTELTPPRFTGGNIEKGVGGQLK